MSITIFLTTFFVLVKSSKSAPTYVKVGGGESDIERGNFLQ